MAMHTYYVRYIHSKKFHPMLHQKEVLVQKFTGTKLGTKIHPKLHYILRLLSECFTFSGATHH